MLQAGIILPGSTALVPSDYNTKFFGVGEKYFSDYNIEIKKKLSETWHTGFYYINQFYNKEWQEGGDKVNANILSAEATYNFSNRINLFAWKESTCGLMLTEKTGPAPLWNLTLMINILFTSGIFIIMAMMKMKTFKRITTMWAGLTVLGQPVLH